MVQNEPDIPYQAPKSPGRFRADQLMAGMGMLFSLGWVLCVVFVFQGGTWVLEQLVFSGMIIKIDLRWGIGLMEGAALWLPLMVVERSQARTFGWAIRPLRLAAELVILAIPARLLRMTDSQTVALAQMVALGVFLVRLSWPIRRAERLPGRSGWLAAWAAGILLLPWAAWGALGSALDILLGLGVAGLAAWTALRLLQPAADHQPGGLAWLAAPGVMLILAAALGLNGTEWLLAGACLGTGWLILVLVRKDPGSQRSGEWAAVIAASAAFAGPLLWIDPDELMEVISGGAGELGEWAAITMGVSLALTLVAVVLIRAVRWHEQRHAHGLPAIWAAVPALVGWLVVYLALGQPGLYGERLFVVFKEQADVSSARAIPDYASRRSMVYRELTSLAERSQADLRRSLDGLGIRYQPYYLVNGMEVEAGPLVRAWLMSRPEVDRVLDSPRLRPLPAPVPVAQGEAKAPAGPGWNLTMIRAERVWNELHVTGKGILIGQSDSGVDGSHPELAEQYRGRSDPQANAWLDPWSGTHAPVDTGGHGTHTLGLALGKSVGVAPGAEWIGCVNLERNLGNPALYLDCLQFMLAPYPAGANPLRNGQPAKGAQVLNNSWGCPEVEGCDAGSLQPAVRALSAAGVFVVVSAGNEGDSGCGSLQDPLAIYADSFSVGAVNSSRRRASFSSLGPVTVDGSSRKKPDLAAPGEAVLSAFPQGSYASLDGTSMAGPHAVGVVALMWSANPRLIGDIERTRQILLETAQPYTGPDAGCGTGNTVGVGILDAYAAVQAALNIR